MSEKIKFNQSAAALYVEYCKRMKKPIDVETLAEKCGFYINAHSNNAGYIKNVEEFNNYLFKGNEVLSVNSKGIIVVLDDIKIIFCDKDQSCYSKRLVAAYLLGSYLLKGQEIQNYADSYDEQKLQKDILEITIDMLLSEELLNSKLDKMDFDELMKYFKVPEDVLRSKVLINRRMVK